MNLSKLMTAYNFAKWSGYFEPGRVNKALGILMANSNSEYITTFTSCTCADFAYRGMTCKHSVALMIERKVEELGK
jgi:predicted nucleic acid-binding Zn finger protein